MRVRACVGVRASERGIELGFRKTVLDTHGRVGNMSKCRVSCCVGGLFFVSRHFDTYCIYQVKVARMGFLARGTGNSCVTRERNVREKRGKIQNKDGGAKLFFSTFESLPKSVYLMR